MYPVPPLRKTRFRPESLAVEFVVVVSIAVMSSVN